MEAFAVASGVAGLLSLTLEIARILSDYTGGVKSATRDERSILTEITALNHVLQQLITFLRADDTNAKCRFRDTSALCSVIAICRDHIETLYRKLKYHGKPEKDLLGRLKWPFEKKENQEIVEVLHRCSQTFMFSLQIANCELLSQTSAEVVQRLDEEKKKIDAMALMFPVQMQQSDGTLADIKALLSMEASKLDKISTNVVSLNRGQQDYQRIGILNWLSPLQPQKRHQDVRSMRLDNTGRWLLNDHRFIAWLKGEKELEPEARLLCCYGMPGAGKTIICSAVIDYLCANQERLISTPQGKVGIACFYCDYRDQKDQTGTPILGSLVAQLLMELSDVPVDIARAFTDSKNTRKSLECQQSLKMLQNLIQGFDQSFICIDAVDELDAETQQTLLRSIRDLLGSSRARNTRILITGRPHIEPYIVHHFPKAVSANRKIEIVASKDDITRFLSHYIETKDPIPHASAMNDELKSKIITTIIKKSQGMFLLPALHIQAILDEPTIGHREDALEVLPDKLHGAYEQTITRIRSQPNTRAMQGQMVLTLVFLAKRPLSLEELQHALAVRTDVAISRAFDAKRICSRDVLLGSCLGLVIVDEETGTVRLVHFSLQEFLEKPVQDTPVELGPASIARLCLTYLHFYRSERLTHILSQRCRKCDCIWEYPLLMYAATEWAHHVRDSKDSSLYTLAVNWLKNARHMCVFGLLDQKQCQGTEDYVISGKPCFATHYQRDHPWGLTILHHAAYIGEPEVFQQLYKYLQEVSNFRDTDLNSRNTCGWTLLPWAAAMGHTELVTCLLLKYPGVDPNCANSDGKTALHLATRCQKSEVMQCLQKDARVDLNIQDCNGETALHLAIKSAKSEGIVECLLKESRVDPNIQDGAGQTALHLAIKDAKWEGIVECLLKDSRVDPNIQDCNGETALDWAMSVAAPLNTINLLHQYMSGELKPTSANRKRKNTFPGAAEPIAKRLELDIELSTSSED